MEPNKVTIEYDNGTLWFNFSDSHAHVWSISREDPANLYYKPSVGARYKWCGTSTLEQRLATTVFELFGVLESARNLVKRSDMDLIYDPHVHNPTTDESHCDFCGVDRMELVVLLDILVATLGIERTEEEKKIAEERARN